MRSISRASNLVPERDTSEEDSHKFSYYRPKYHTVHRTDVSRYTNLEHLKASFYLRPTSSNHCIKKELKVEPVTFREDHSKKEMDNKSLYSVISRPKSTTLEYDYNQKRRPSLRSSLSDLQHIVKSPTFSSYYSSSSYYNTFDSHHKRYTEDEESLLYIDTGTKSCGSHGYTSFCLRLLPVMMLFLLVCMIIMVRPLAHIDITSITNVLATEKQLMFDLHVRAKNSNNWNIHVAKAKLNVYAKGSHNSSNQEPFEHLGTLHHLIDPLLFQSSPFLYFKTRSTIATSQIQITNPGKEEQDDTWPLLIRSPFQMAVAGVLYHKPLPFFTSSFSSTHLCFVINVDPILRTTTVITDQDLNEQVCSQNPI